jgi:hypothetical protein
MDELMWIVYRQAAARFITSGVLSYPTPVVQQALANLLEDMFEQGYTAGRESTLSEPHALAHQQWSEEGID